jgi:UDP-N-acetylglucosamine 2-epimerase (non-hydrolysing)
MRKRPLITTVVGARPNFVKAAGLVRGFRENPSIRHILLHTGQHYDHPLDKALFADLNLPKPITNLGVGSGTHGAQLGALFTKLGPALEKLRPDLLLVVGDVNSTLAATVLASRAGIASGHVEAGLRSRDLTMPEESNRIIADHLATLLFAPSLDAVDNLRSEGIRGEGVWMVGNVMVDALRMLLPHAKKARACVRFNLRPGSYALLTLHRAETVDHPKRFARILEAVHGIASDLPILFPVHPRARKHLPKRRFLISPGEATSRSHAILIAPPQGYLDFLSLQSDARLVLTDSGGVQEETTVLGIPCVTIRDVTERPITVSRGTNVVAGRDPDGIITAARRQLERPKTSRRRPPLWDGKTGHRIARRCAYFLGLSAF